MIHPLILRGAHIWDAGAGLRRRDLFTNGAVLAAPAQGAEVIDLEGCAIFPGLINAHDHLELNHFPRTTFRARYPNAHEWGEDVQAHLEAEPLKSLRAYPLADRCFIGGLKNLLCGALTVVHHNPAHRCLFGPSFPVRVLRRYGWAHSLHFTSEAEIVRSFRATLPGVPWFIHLAEGTDDVAGNEYRRLKTLGCLGINTVIIHGVGLSQSDVADADALHHRTSGRGLKLVWCPSTNLFLLGQTLSVDLLGPQFQPAAGSDSRLTADGDLLDELACLRRILPFAAEAAQSFTLACVTEHARRILYCRDAGHLNSGAQADWIALRHQAAVAGAGLGTRADLALVVRAGVPQIGDPDVMAKFPWAQAIPATLDGRPKRVHVRLAAQIARCSLHEHGLEIDPDFARRAQRRWLRVRAWRPRHE